MDFVPYRYCTFVWDVRDGWEGHGSGEGGGEVMEGKLWQEDVHQ